MTKSQVPNRSVSMLGIWVLGFGISAASPGCAARHHARGLVLKVDPAASMVTVSHEPIPGFMDAMVMPFAVGDATQLADVRPGDRIAFRLKVRRDRTKIDRIELL